MSGFDKFTYGDWLSFFTSRVESMGGALDVGAISDVAAWFIANRQRFTCGAGLVVGAEGGCRVDEIVGFNCTCARESRMGVQVVIGVDDALSSVEGKQHSSCAGFASGCGGRDCGCAGGSARVIGGLSQASLGQCGRCFRRGEALSAENVLGVDVEETDTVEREVVQQEDGFSVQAERVRAAPMSTHHHCVRAPADSEVLCGSVPLTSVDHRVWRKEKRRRYRQNRAAKRVGRAESSSDWRKKAEHTDDVPVEVQELRKLRLSNNLKEQRLREQMLQVKQQKVNFELNTLLVGAESKVDFIQRRKVENQLAIEKAKRALDVMTSRTSAEEIDFKKKQANMREAMLVANIRKTESMCRSDASGISSKSGATNNSWRTTVSGGSNGSDNSISSHYKSVRYPKAGSISPSSSISVEEERRLKAEVVRLTLQVDKEAAAHQRQIDELKVLMNVAVAKAISETKRGIESQGIENDVV